ncbi:SDR family NAD(P)-dependent oxidoreductase [Pseudomonas abietaniphila]
MGRLEGKVAVVTGGNSGIGLASACLFAREGAHVIVTARRKEALDKAVDLIGHGAVGVQGDVALAEHHFELKSHIEQRFGGLDIYMANAGTIMLSPSSEVTQRDYDTQFNTNTRGVFFGVQSVMPLMREEGSIILTSSLAATKVLEGHAVYAGSKAAIAAFARSWALELRARRIRVNVLSPGPVDTPIIGALGIKDEHRAGFFLQMADIIPAGRMGDVEELARAALYLASAESSFVNGIELQVDGGMSLV